MLLVWVLCASVGQERWRMQYAISCMSWPGLINSWLSGLHNIGQGAECLLSPQPAAVIERYMS
jgi:hypothetical protein